MSNEIDIFDEEDEIFDASTLEGVQAENGKQLSGLVRRLNEKQEQIDETEKYLKELKAEKQRIAFEHIPMLMDEMGMERIDVDGLTVKLKPFVTASIPADRKQDAFNWLREHGLDDIIKNDIIVSFGRGQDNKAGDVMYDLEQKGFHPEQKTHIHSMTLKAFVRERVEKGLPIDLDMFGAFVARTAEVKRNSK
jgi:hypothetical protein|tara:strand:- start:3536 stop:4114 length:579 start_codon:yes stop_codon:yes gene_type:complete